MARAALLPVALLLCLALAGSADARRKAGGGFYELKNKNGDFSIKVTNQGAAIVSAIVPDGKGMAAFLLASRSLYACLHLVYQEVESFYAGNLADIVLGYDTVSEYAVRSRAPLFSLFRISITYTLFSYSFP
jgi:aldose 1-epimerase